MSTFNTALQKQVAEFLKVNNHSQAAFAKLAGVKPPVVSQWLSSSYGANPTKIEKRFQDALEGYEKSARVGPPEIIETQITAEVHEALSIALKADSVFVISGDAGKGKTMALRSFVAGNSRAHLITVTPQVRSALQLTAAVWTAIGSPVIPAGGSKFDAVCDKLRNSAHVLIFDDAHQLASSAWDFIMALHDNTGVGVALVGNPEILKKAEAWEQWKTRISGCYKVDFAASTAKECDDTLAELTHHLAAHYLRGYDDARAAMLPALLEIARATRNPRDLAQILKLARVNLLATLEPAAALSAALNTKKLPVKLNTPALALP